MERSTSAERDLLDRFAGGDPAALEALVDAFFPIMCRFAEKFVPDADSAKDIVQEAFINLWNARKPFATVAGLRSFLFTATRNGCLNNIRGRERQEQKHQAASALDATEMDSVLTEMVRAEFLQAVYATVRSMPPQMQEIFYLSFKEGMTVKEISIHLNINLKTVKKQKYKALVALRSKFGPGGPVVLLFF